MYLQCPLTLLFLKNRTTKTPLQAKKMKKWNTNVDLLVHVHENPPKNPKNQ